MNQKENTIGSITDPLLIGEMTSDNNFQQYG
jgi:hypothetical protein